MNSGGGAAFPRSARLTKPSDFKKVFANPLVSADSCFKVLGRPRVAGRWRLGMAVSRQVDKRAVGRNRIKRIIRESFRQWQHGLPDEVPALDVVVLPRRGIASISNDCLADSLAAHWARLERLALRSARAKAPQNRSDAATNGSMIR